MEYRIKVFYGRIADAENPIRFQCASYLIEGCVFIAEVVEHLRTKDHIGRMVCKRNLFGACLDEGYAFGIGGFVEHFSRRIYAKDYALEMLM
jgi:hypothetical protein